jgi:hypothetical protein
LGGRIGVLGKGGNGELGRWGKLESAVIGH